MGFAVRNVESDDLTHYGVIGMKWGVRKEYQKVGRKRSKPTLVQAVRKTKKTKDGDSLMYIRDKQGYEILKSYNDIFKDELPTVYASETEAKMKFKNLRQARMNLSDEQQQLATNHNANSYERKINCFECTMAYEMRQRGYVVQSNEQPGGFMFQTLHAFNVKDSFQVQVVPPEGSSLSSETLARECYRRIEEQCLSYGEGARGNLGFAYADYDTGHAMSWVVKDGKFSIIDTQSNAVAGYDSFLMCDSNVEVYRLDNAEVLPGVTDFVENFEQSEEEKAAEEERIKAGKELRARREKELSEKIKADKKDQKRRRREWEKQNGVDDDVIETIGRTIKEIADRTVKDVGNFISNGKDAVDKFLKNPFNIQSNSTTKSGNARMIRKRG